MWASAPDRGTIRGMSRVATPDSIASTSESPGQDWWRWSSTNSSQPCALGHLVPSSTGRRRERSRSETPERVLQNWVGGFGTGDEHVLLTLHASTPEAMKGYGDRLCAWFAEGDAFRELWRSVDGATNGSGGTDRAHRRAAVLRRRRPVPRAHAGADAGGRVAADRHHRRRFRPSQRYRRRRHPDPARAGPAPRRSIARARRVPSPRSSLCGSAPDCRMRSTTTTSSRACAKQVELLAGPPAEPAPAARAQ